MIIRSAPIRNLGFRCGVAWLLAAWFINLIVWTQWLYDGADTSELEWLWKDLPMVAIPFFLTGFVAPRIVRVWHFSVVFGVGLGLPILLASVTPFVIMVHKINQVLWKYSLSATFILSLTVVAVRSFLRTREKVKVSRYLEKQVKKTGDFYYISRDKSADFFKVHPKESDQIFGRFWIGPVIFLSSTAFPLQRVLLKEFGAVSLLILTLALLTPVSFWVIRMMSMSLVLWIFSIRDFEKLKMSKVFLLE